MARNASACARPGSENGRLIGMVTDRDIFCCCVARGLEPRTMTARNVMTNRIMFCLDKQELDDSARMMETKKIHRLPVINGKSRVVGMLSLGESTMPHRDLSAERRCRPCRRTIDKGGSVIERLKVRKALPQDSTPVADGEHR